MSKGSTLQHRSIYVYNPILLLSVPYYSIHLEMSQYRGQLLHPAFVATSVGCSELCNQVFLDLVIFL